MLNYEFDWSVLWREPYGELMLRGIFTTIHLPLCGGLFLTFQLAVITQAGGFLLGVILGLARLSSRKWIFVPATLYVNLFRSLPLILVIFWFYFLVPLLIGRSLGDFLSAVIAFVAFESAYFAEIIRGGIQSVPAGQMEAGFSTGLYYHQVMLYVILPQAVRNMIPPHRHARCDHLPGHF